MAKKKKIQVQEIQEEKLEVGKTGVFKISFEKLDGTLREMVCTKDKSVIEENGYEFSTSETRTKNPNIETIFDLDKKAWRSFRKENLKSVEKWTL
jgi:uncharacterized protein YggL (DUF469 family)